MFISGRKRGFAQQLLSRCHAKTIAALVFTTIVSVATVSHPSVAYAYAHSCESNWCSGSDGNQATNSQDNGPQVYMGEVGVYHEDFGSDGGPCPSDYYEACFNATGANAAQTRYAYSEGIGTQFYYLAGGADSMYAPDAPSAYCFGWDQGYYAVSHVVAHYSAYEDTSWIMAIDIEQNDTFGWGTTDQSANREVFNGFTDYVAERSSQDPSDCNNTNTSIQFQYAVYSSPDQWLYSFGWDSAHQGHGNIPNTVEWTSEYCCTATDPGSFTPGTNPPSWFGGSSYHFEWQFDEGGTADDFDLAYVPMYLPVFGISPWT